jgi:DNA (cytosine-5)-methyltransferase 1
LTQIASAPGLVYGSVCSGIEAASAAWHSLGWSPSFFSEIDAFPRAVLAHRFPEVPLHGDFTTIQAGDYRPIDLLVGGTPCQSFSIAGLRGGLDDDRGNLALEYLRLADRLRPRWLVWENVPGVLSSNGGRDFGSILGGMVQLGYGFAYRVLDAQFFGVAQRRRRVFVVGHLGDWRPAAAVLFERHSLRGDPPPSRTAGKGTSTDVAPSLVASGRGVERTGDTRGQDPLVAVPAIANPLTARMHKGVNTTMDEGQTMIVEPVAYSIMPMNSGQDYKARETDIAQPVMTSPVGGNQGGDYVVQPIAIQERAICENPNAGPDGAGFRADGAAYTLEARTVPQAVAFAPDVARSLTARHDSSPCADRGMDVVAQSALQVRRLTPTECERLQGFPDGWTAIPYRGKPASDGPRYKALGNSMAVPVMAWIGQRIDQVDKIVRGQ